jgi:hypothetical protein
MAQSAEAGEMSEPAVQLRTRFLARVFETIFYKSGFIDDRDLARLAARAAALGVYAFVLGTLLGTLGLGTQILCWLNMSAD